MTDEQSERYLELCTLIDDEYATGELTLEKLAAYKAEAESFLNEDEDVGYLEPFVMLEDEMNGRTANVGAMLARYRKG